jgi:uncharacterized protein YigE (DUF2233 family)
MSVGLSRSNWTLALVGLSMAAAGGVWWLTLPPKTADGPAPELPSQCRELDFEAVAYVVCEVDTASDRVDLFLRDIDGKPFGSLPAFDAAVAKRDTPIMLAMNAGMYHEDLTPVGLYVSDGRLQSPLNLADGEGNFFLKPNGVFFIGNDGSAGVIETTAFAATKPEVRLATQSGPMLVIDGHIHPRFEQNGTSRFIRNGVGVRDAHTVVLAISRSEVSLGSFARLFRDALGCRNALFFDGAISALSNGKEMVIGGEFPAGPIIAVSAKP